MLLYWRNARRFSRYRESIDCVFPARNRKIGIPFAAVDTNRPVLTFELVTGDVPPVLLGKSCPSGGAIYVPRQSLLAQAGERPRAAEVATALVEGHVGVGLLSYYRGLQATYEVVGSDVPQFNRTRRRNRSRK